MQDQLTLATTVAALASVCAGLQRCVSDTLALRPACALQPPPINVLRWHILPVAGSAPARNTCLATLSFLQLATCVVGPSFLSVYSWRDVGPPTPLVLQRRWHRRCHVWALRAEHASSRVLCWLLHNPAGGLPSWLAVAWWLLALAWLYCKRLAGLA